MITNHNSIKVTKLSSQRIRKRYYKSLGTSVINYPSLPAFNQFRTWGGLGNRLLSQACLRAAVGVILADGSHSKQRRIKSKNSGSSQPLSAVRSSRDPGGPRGLPRRLRPPFNAFVPSGNVQTVQYLGYPKRNKNI